MLLVTSSGTAASYRDWIIICSHWWDETNRMCLCPAEGGRGALPHGGLHGGGGGGVPAPGPPGSGTLLQSAGLWGYESSRWAMNHLNPVEDKRLQLCQVQWCGPKLWVYLKVFFLFLQLLWKQIEMNSTRKPWKLWASKGYFIKHVFSLLLAATVKLWQLTLLNKMF